MQPPRQIVVLHMLVLALRDYPGVGWDELVKLTCEFGASLRSGPVRPAEVQALRGMTVEQIAQAL